MPTYIRITVETDLKPIDAIDALAKALAPDRVSLPPDGISQISKISAPDDTTIGTMAIYTTTTRKG